MTSNEERRQAAKRKLEERLAAQRAQARKRRRIILGSTGFVVVVAIAVGAYFAIDAYQDHVYNSEHARCDYVDAKNNFGSLPPVADNLTGEQATFAAQYKDRLATGEKKARTTSKPDSRPKNSGKVDLTMQTSQGAIPMTLNRSGAACNVNAFVHLADEKYFNDSDCHRLVTATEQSKLAVLQCGDPTATGLGNPGWSSPDEFPTDLKTVPGSEQQMPGSSLAIYPRGTIAIANSYSPGYGSAPTGQNTGSAQFFIVAKDSQLPPNYSVVGTVDDAGMAVIDKVYAAGVTPTPEPSGQDQATGKLNAFATSPTDGAPKLPVHIETAKVA
ncbi:peptidylprolyl isomerase [Gordonia jinhuaensis]|uniref:Peptidyl-prolyl cis-trans isomerase n=1 Tax=Gordonia jinhuaensis TaxID=1517702 RepID=A0A916TFV7_9ACTN|nr:peptidylprolyl isomerase [Gordonia jinhuaensis]GGB43394.1 peptidyl-prolyl cis-trans isomerase [Gordonia jinhuaensis]